MVLLLFAFIRQAYQAKNVLLHHVPVAQGRVAVLVGYDIERPEHFIACWSLHSDNIGYLSLLAVNEVFMFFSGNVLNP